MNGYKKHIPKERVEVVRINRGTWDVYRKTYPGEIKQPLAYFQHIPSYLPPDNRDTIEACAELFAESVNVLNESGMTPEDLWKIVQEHQKEA